MYFPCSIDDLSVSKQSKESIDQWVTKDEYICQLVDVKNMQTLN